MTRGRPRLFERPPLEWTISVPPQLGMDVMEELARKGGSVYGARSLLITQLLTEWLNKQHPGVSDARASLPRL